MKERDELLKAQQDRLSHINDLFVKGKDLPIGSTSTHGGVKVKKVGPGKWEPVKGEGKAKQSVVAGKTKTTIAPKDWERMLTIVMKGSDGDKVAKLITKKDKAIARFVAGLKLANRPLEGSFREELRKYGGSYEALGNKAIQLGATPEEIQATYDATTVPQKYVDKMASLGGKKLQDRFVGDVSRAVLNLGMDIEYQPHSGNAITFAGKEAMQRNGRKWTIGYKSEIDLGDNSKVNFTFDAITDEGGGPTFYRIDHSSDPMFSKLQGITLGKQKFISDLKEIIKKQ